MTLRIYNTRTGDRELFTPIQPGHVRMYVCGVTVYNLCHMGHGRAAVVFDVVYRELRRRGFQIDYVRNYTDVDDKIIRRGLEEGLTALEVADKYVAATRQDMEALGCLPPTHEPRVTRFIEPIIQLIERLIASGHAYAAENGDVYYAVESFAPYGDFSHRNLSELRAGARIEVNEDKRNPLDFALWKGAKPGEPAWESPWGLGRPGWHIECSAMANTLLGETMDIHGGGSDLIFPHHENEIAQSEAATEKPLARYWMHNGMITVDGEKMSKSLNNFFTIRDALVRFNREALRLFLLSTQYRSPVDFSNESLEEAEAGLERLYQAVAQAEKLIERDKTPRGAQLRELLAGSSAAMLLARHPWTSIEAPWDVPVARWSAAEQELMTLAEQVRIRLDEAMEDDFNTARALGHLFELARGIGRFATVQPRGGAQASPALGAALIVLRGFCQEVLGLLTLSPTAFQEDLNLRRLQGRDITAEEIAAQIAAREEARACKDWSRSDRIRDELAAKGVLLEDSREGTLWKVTARSSSAPTSRRDA
jgi:cysteinyl-tRNA synthetase